MPWRGVRACAELIWRKKMTCGAARPRARRRAAPARAHGRSGLVPAWGGAFGMDSGPLGVKNLVFSSGNRLVSSVDNKKSLQIQPPVTPARLRGCAITSARTKHFIWE